MAEINQEKCKIQSAESDKTFGMLCLIKKDGRRSTSFPLIERRCLFGRQDHCDIRINLLDVSREHAEIIVDEKDQV
jgi:pSer/pThr/pTyr-binding forkhead associated (FHA) protein